VKDGKVKALFVSGNDAGANNLFVMITSISQGSDTSGKYDVVSGLAFGGAAGPWNYEDDGLLNKLTTYGVAPTTVNLAGYLNGTDNRGRYDRIVKFRLGEDGTLKDASVVALGTDSSNGIDYYRDEIGNRGGFQYVSRYNVGSNFTLTVSNSAISPGRNLEVAFESDAVMYVLSGTTWSTERPNTYNFAMAPAEARYVFVRTDKDKAGYDVIIRIDNVD
jgi:hypothetical protein